MFHGGSFRLSIAAFLTVFIFSLRASVTRQELIELLWIFRSRGAIIFCMNKRHNRSGKLSVAVASVVAAALLAGCGGSAQREENRGAETSSENIEEVTGKSTVSSSSSVEEESRVIALAIADKKPSERWDDELAVFEKCAEEQNCRLRVIDAEGDASKQAEKCAAFLNSGTVDAMIVQPVDPEQASGIVSSAHDVGVPVIAYEQMIQNADVDYFVCAKTEPEDEKEPRRALAKAAGVLAGMAARGEYPMSQDMTVDGNWTEMTVGSGTVNVFVVSDPAGADQPDQG
jgi:hypothetical protein